MKLYFSPGACSLSPHIALREAGLAFELERVDLRTHKTEKGTDYYTVNPKGYVPALALDRGGVLTEGPAIVQYVADQKPESKLAPAAGTLERYRLEEWLLFISTEIHKTFSPLFYPATPEETKRQNVEKLHKRFDYAAKALEGHQFLLGEHFSVADGYLFVMLNWSRKMVPDVLKNPTLHAYFDRIAARPSVKAALAAEGLKS